MKIKKSKYYNALICIISFLILLLFATRTSPQYSLLYCDYTGNDASHAMLVGKYWLQGSIPYKDLYITEGPLYLFFQALGWLIGQRTGIFFLEFINLLIFFMFSKKTMCLFSTEKKAFYAILIVSIPFIAMCSGGNSASEWSLSLTAIALWILCHSIIERDISTCYATILGFLIGCLLFLWYPIAFLFIPATLYYWCVFVENNKLKKFSAFTVGIMVPIVIIILYFYKERCCMDMLNWAITYPIKMQLSKAFTDTAVIVHKLVKCCICTPIILSGIYFYMKKEQRTGALMIVFFVSSVVLLMLSDNNWVNFLAVIPFILPAIVMLSNKFSIVSFIVILGICIMPLKNFGTYLLRGVTEGAQDFYECYVNYINDEPEHRVMMIDLDSSYLLLADQKPNVSYFSNQTSMAQYDKEAKKALEQYISSEWNPDIIISQEHRWGNLQSEEYRLTQVFVREGGNISIYFPYDMLEE